MQWLFTAGSVDCQFILGTMVLVVCTITPETKPEWIARETGEHHISNIGPHPKAWDMIHACSTVNPIFYGVLCSVGICIYLLINIIVPGNTKTKHICLKFSLIDIVIASMAIMLDFCWGVGVSPPSGFGQNGPINTKMHKLETNPTKFHSGEKKNVPLTSLWFHQKSLKVPMKSSIPPGLEKQIQSVKEPCHKWISILLLIIISSSYFLRHIEIPQFKFQELKRHLSFHKLSFSLKIYLFILLSMLL